MCCRARISSNGKGRCRDAQKAGEVAMGLSDFVKFHWVDSLEIVRLSQFHSHTYEGHSPGLQHGETAIKIATHLQEDIRSSATKNVANMSDKGTQCEKRNTANGQVTILEASDQREPANPRGAKNSVAGVY